eukprot:7386948-Prymnesium_polylepis.3
MAGPVVALLGVESRTPVMENESRPVELWKAGELKSLFVEKLDSQLEAHSRTESPAQTSMHQSPYARNTRLHRLRGVREPTHRTTARPSAKRAHSPQCAHT